jgi:hypothetical protein
MFLVSQETQVARTGTCGRKSRHCTRQQQQQEQRNNAALATPAACRRSSTLIPYDGYPDISRGPHDVVRHMPGTKHEQQGAAQIVQHRVNTKELHTLKMIQKTKATYLELDTHISGYRKPRRLFQTTLMICCCRAHLLNVTSFEHGCPTAEQLACSAVTEERVSNSCATRSLHTVLQPSETVCKLRVAQLSETFFTDSRSCR